MTKEKLSYITKRYNAERHNFNFPTVPASEEKVKSILKMDKKMEELPDDKLIFKIAVVINDLTFSWY